MIATIWIESEKINQQLVNQKYNIEFCLVAFPHLIRVD